MRCGKVRHQLSGYMDGVLELKRCLKVDEHLQRCSHCRLALEDLRAVKRLLNRAPSPIARAGFWDGLCSQMGRRPPALSRSFRELLRLPQVRIPALAAGAIAIVFGIAVLGSLLLGGREKQLLSAPMLSDLARYGVSQPLNDPGALNYIHAQSNMSSLDSPVVFVSDNQ